MSNSLKRSWKWGFALTSLALAACGSNDSWTAPPLPQLAAAVPASFVGDCADLNARIASLPNTTVTAVNKMAAGAVMLAGTPIPEHCQVLGSMYPRVSAVDGLNYAIKFEMRLPKAWNGRFYHQGNGGIDGTVVSAFGNLGGGATTNALLQGFAVLSSDAGHAGSQGPGFGIDPQARLDYGYQAVGKLTPMAKSVITAAYSKAPDRSYLGGCSNGGRHAMVAATRYFNDYDGILAGAPGYNLPKAATANLAAARLWASVATAPAINSFADLATGFTDAERVMMSKAITAKCDALDGAPDGYVSDAAACQGVFNLATDVPTCAAARDGTCLSSAQKTVISNIWSGLKTSTGTPIYASFPYDPGMSTGTTATNSGFAFWKFFAPLNLDSGSTGVIFQVPPASVAAITGPSFALTTNIDTLYANMFATNATYTESAMAFMTPVAPTQMAGLRDKGGKILVYHGNSDPIFSVHDTVAWYDGLTAENGGSASQFARLFRVPQMGHCSGGPAADQFDMITPLVNWVEKGQAPDQIVATARGAGNAGGVNAEVPSTWSATRSRPLCAYPKVAKFVAGDVEAATSFSCQ